MIDTSWFFAPLGRLAFWCGFLGLTLWMFGVFEVQWIGGPVINGVFGTLQRFAGLGAVLFVAVFVLMWAKGLLVVLFPTALERQREQEAHKARIREIEVETFRQWQATGEVPPLGEGVLLTTTAGDKIRLTVHVDSVEASGPKFLVKQKNDAKHPGFLVTDTEPARQLQQRLEKREDVWVSVVIEPAQLLSRQPVDVAQWRPIPSAAVMANLVPKNMRC